MKISRHGALENEVYVPTYREENLNWRASVFLPFDPFWRTLLLVLCTVEFVSIVYFEVFMMVHILERTGTLKTALHCIYVLFIIDTMLSIVHRMWLPVNRSRTHESKHIILIFIDIFSLVPTYLFIDYPFVMRDHSINWLALLNMNRCCRIYRVFLEAIQLRQVMGLNRIMVTVLTFNTIMMTSSIIFGTIWFVMGYSEIGSGPEGTWLTRMKLNLDINDPTEMSLISFIHALNALSNAISTEIYTYTTWERIFEVFLMMIGFFFKNALGMAFFISSSIGFHRHQYKIREYIDINMQYLKGYKAKEVKDYYNTFWHVYSGLYTCPLLETLPLCLQKDLLLDVYWNALEHSNVLRHFSINIKRQISLMMKSKFLQPGEYIYRKGEMRYVYYYITNGLVEVMSHYDGVSPIVTLSRGSCIGSMVVALPSKSPTDVICSTFCEVFYLTYDNLRAALMMYPPEQGSRALESIIKGQIQHAKLMISLTRSYSVKNKLQTIYGVPHSGKLHWIKNRWRTMFMLGEVIPTALVTEKVISKLKNVLLPIESTHTSMNLDLIVLSSKDSSSTHRCCLKSSCSYVMEPRNNFLKVWLHFMVIMTSLDCVIIPTYIAFGFFDIGWLIIWCQNIALIYLFDIYFQAITAVKSIDENITEPMPLLRHRLKSIIFLLEAVAAIPIGTLIRLVTSRKISSLVNIPRMLKIIHVFCFFNYKYTLIMGKRLTIDIIKYTFVCFYFTHFASCLNFMIACQMKGDGGVECDPYSWYNTGKIMREAAGNNEDKTFYTSYHLNSLYYSMVSCLKSGIQDVMASNLREIIMSNVIIIISTNIYLWIHSEAIAVCILGKERLQACRELIDSINSVLTQKSIHQGLRIMLGRYIELQWISNAAIEIGKSRKDIMCPMLQEKLDILKRSTVRQVPFFNEMEPEIFEKVIDAFTLYTVPRGFIFCRSGEHSSSFNILIQGYCNITSMLREDVREFPGGKAIGPGAFFPLMEILQNSPCYQTTISQTECRVATIEVFRLRDIINKDMFILNDIKNASSSDDKDVDVIVSKAKYRREKVKSKNIVWLDSPKREKSSNKTWSFRRLLESFLLPFMIEPSSPLMFYYEAFKSVRVVLSIFFFANFYTLYCSLGSTRTYVAFIFDIFSFVDIYVGFNTGRYNEDGLIFSSPKYYFEHGLCVDVLSSLPIYLILEDFNLGLKFYSLLSLKLLQIYRLHGFFKVLRIVYANHVIKWEVINFGLHWFLVTVCLSNLSFVDSCSVRCEEGEMPIPLCKTHSWFLTNEFYSESNSVSELILFGFETLLTIFIGNTYEGFRATNQREIIMSILLAIISCAIKFYYIRKITSLLIGGRVALRKYTENIKLYWRFIADQGGDRAVANHIYKHFQYTQTRTKGVNMRTFLDSLHPSLRMDSAFALYYKPIEILHQFVGDDRSFIKLIANVLEEGYYRKGTTIINKSQLNNKIYFISQGYIDVYNEEDHVFKSLGRGSMFGCVNISGKFRHRLTFKARLHVNLLEVGSTEFHMLYRQYNPESEKAFIARAKKKEFFEYRTNDSVLDLNEDYEFGEINLMLLHKNSNFHQWLMFYMSSVLPYLTIFPILFTISTDIIETGGFVTMIYILDVIALGRIYIGMNTTFTDEHTGRIIMKKKAIRLSYVLRKNGFFLDVISVIPFELIVHLVTGKRVYESLRINRLLRIYMLIEYILQHKEKDYVRAWLRCQEMIIYSTVVPFIAMCVWIFVLCNDDDCYFKVNDEWQNNLDSSQKLIRVLNKVVTLFIMIPSYTYKSPASNAECFLMIIFLMMLFLLLPFVIGNFTQMFEAADFQKKRFQYKLDCMKSFLQIRDLSESLLKSLWSYSLWFWKTNHGQTYPEFVEKAPVNLKSKFLCDLYGDHLKYNALFEDCQSDFIIQLSQRLQRAVYFPGYFLIHEFDVDDRMYFINSGEVDVVDFDGLHMEVDRNIHITGECFGLAQGLFDRKPHLFNYKARNTVEVLFLQRTDWEDLLDAFPQEKLKIYRNANKLELS